MELKDPTFCHYAMFRRTPRWVELPEAEKAAAAEEVEAAFRAMEGKVLVRGTYSSAGFRDDVDVLFWLLSRSPDDVQALISRLRRTTFGRTLDLRFAWLGVTLPPEFAREHQPAFMQGKAPLKYVCVYPFIRTHEWYLLPPAERGQLLRIHGELGRDFGDIQTNTVSSFGLNDYEWLLAFEAEQLERIVMMIRKLREAQARQYTRKEDPFVIGIQKSIPEILADLG